METGRIDRSVLLDVIQMFLDFQRSGLWIQLNELNTEVHKLMATVAELKAAVDKVKLDTAAAIGRVAEDVAKLKDDIANGGTVKEADLGPIAAGLADISAALGTLDPLPDFPAPSPAPTPEG